MPKATTSIGSQKFDLNSCPGGYVELKRMTYGQKLERRDMVAKMSAEMTPGSNRQQSVKALMEMSNKAVAMFDFKNCVVNHNLFEDDEETIPLNFTAPDILQKLDPRIGDEIDQLIDKMNNYDAEQDISGN